MNSLADTQEQINGYRWIYGLPSMLDLMLNALSHTLADSAFKGIRLICRLLNHVFSV